MRGHASPWKSPAWLEVQGHSRSSRRQEEAFKAPFKEDKISYVLGFGLLQTPVPSSLSVCLESTPRYMWPQQPWDAGYSLQFLFQPAGPRLSSYESTGKSPEGEGQTQDRKVGNTLAGKSRGDQEPHFVSYTVFLVAQGGARLDLGNRGGMGRFGGNSQLTGPRQPQSLSSVRKTKQVQGREAFHKFPEGQTPQSHPLTNGRDMQSARPQQKPEREGEAAGLETPNSSEVLILDAHQTLPG